MKNSPSSTYKHFLNRLNCLVTKSTEAQTSVCPTLMAARLITHALLDILMTESNKDKAAALLWMLVSLHALENI